MTAASGDGCVIIPNLDVTERGTVSIARRIQDPLAEKVKVLSVDPIRGRVSLSKLL